MPDVAENGPYAEPRRGASNAWSWTFAPHGRMGRIDFFYAILARIFALYLIRTTISFAAFSAGLEISGRLFDVLDVSLVVLAFVAAAAGPVVRRLHDLNLTGLHSGLLCLALILGERLVRLDWVHPVGALIPILFGRGLMLWPGNASPNRYGPPPA